MSREFDIAVAKALGWQEVVTESGKDRWQSPDENDESLYCAPPSYSTDANEAVKLWAEHLRLPTWWFGVDKNGRWNGDNRKTLDARHFIFVRDCSTLAEAICRAVIAVKGAQ